MNWALRTARVFISLKNALREGGLNISDVSENKEWDFGDTSRWKELSRLEQCVESSLQKNGTTHKTIIGSKPDNLGHQIKNIILSRNNQRYRRKKNKAPIISLIGYTNSGKSTLFNKLTKSNVLSKDMLFASLDSTIRKSFFKNVNFLFVDTVGFIRDLPTTLIDAFKSTLDEIIYSDLILHVRDISSQYYLEQRNEVIKILHEIGIYDDCLLYTSDAADEGLGVDVGGRRVI